MGRPKDLNNSFWAITRSRASRRARFAVVGLTASIAIAGCTQPQRGPDANGEFTISRISDWGVFLVTDRRTTCEYIVNSNGGIILRSDAYGNVTPNCGGSHNYAEPFPYGARADQQVGGK